MPLFVSSSPSKKHLEKTTSAKKILKLYTMLLHPVKLLSVPNRTHARREAITDQAYSTYYSRSVESVKGKMYAEKRAYTSKETSAALSVNDDSSTIVDDPMRGSKHRNFVDDSIFEDFIRRNRERFVREEEETASVGTGQKGSSGRYVMDDWIFEDFIRRNRKRFQHEKEEIISIDDYSDDELDDSVAY